MPITRTSIPKELISGKPKRSIVAEDLRRPKYKPRVVPNKKPSKLDKAKRKEVY